MKVAWDKKLATVTFGRNYELVIRESGATECRNPGGLGKLKRGPLLPLARVAELRALFAPVAIAEPWYGRGETFTVFAYYAAGAKYLSQLSWDTEMGYRQWDGSPPPPPLLALETEMEKALRVWFP